MTEAFDKFMSQATSQGQEYGDGFNSSHFEGLTQSERHNALLILEERALDGDTIAINAINFIGEIEAVKILEKILEKPYSLGQKAINQASLEVYKITRERKHLDHIFNNLNFCSDQDKWHSIQILCSIEYGQDWFDEVRKVFEKIVLDEPDEVLRHTAAKKILLENGVSAGTSTYKEKIQQLINSEIEIRKKALSNL